MNLQSERLSRLPVQIRALIKPAEQKLSELEYITIEARQELYLNAWRSFYTSCPNYLFPDDRGAIEDEFGLRRTEDVSTQSYENTEHTVKQKREDVLQANKERLDRVLLTATDPTTYRNKLAHECRNTAERLAQYSDVFTDLDAQSYSPCLPSPGFWPERRVDEPAHVGAALGLLDFLIYVRAQFWAAQTEAVSLTEAAANQSPTTVRLANTPALIVPDPTNTITAPPLDTLPPPITNKLPIDKVLSISRQILDKLLLNATMIELAAEPGRFRALPQVKPWQWANVRAALREKLLIAEISDAEAAALFKETYGAEVGRTTMQHNPQAELGNKRKTRRVLAYTTILSSLETLITPVKPGF